MDKKLETLVKDNIVMIDTCSLMNENTKAFLFELSAALIKHKKKLIIPEKVIWEFEKKFKFAEDVKLVEICKETKKVLEYMEAEQLINVKGIGDDETKFADSVFITQLIHFAGKGKKIFLITQDKALAVDILTKINKLSFISEKGKAVTVMKLGKGGDLEDHIIEKAA